MNTGIRVPPEEPRLYPKGIPVADSRFHKPLYKMAKMMMRRKTDRQVVKISRKLRKKRHKMFY